MIKAYSASAPTEHRLTYPLEFYYPDGFVDMLSDAEQAKILSACRDRAERLGIRPDEDADHPTSQALTLMMERLRQFDYFQGVRYMVNALLSGHRTPEELYRSLYPDYEHQVRDYRCQFADACDLILLKDQVDWERMGLGWHRFRHNHEPG